MKKWLVGLFAVVALLAPPVVEAQQAVVQLNPDGTAYAYEAITVSTVSIGFTLATISPATGVSAKSAYCSVETNPIRIKLFGTPSSTAGHPFAAATSFSVIGINNLIAFRAIRSGAADATLQCTYFR